ncbi:hypothetical protein HK107_08495 [Parvularcula sp. ZS-1/3]|uniref:Parvulin-like PPIase n=1 Tax=Parvularcula mediterranea TaxID=2732508 RepID=A0A7Y3W5I4_9PROT|nr:peptidyl-prolyl cis-trans isomerase [Parvularcula mediterranea]NNU16357.1 hypothetical protein [Parvularcula mediterranea]
MTQLSSKAGVGAPSSLGFQAKVMGSFLRDFDARTALRAIFCGVLVSAAAAEAIRFGVVERPLSLYANYEEVDPVVARVGDDVLRVSDAMAHAMYTGVDAETAADVPKLIATGTVEDAVDHLALAQMARDAGIADALEIRAAVALAERQILAEAFLDTIARDAASEDKIVARYEAEKATLERDSLMRLSKIVVETEDEAKALAARLPRANFATLAKQKSLHRQTGENGGAMEERQIAELGPELTEALATLPIGGVTEPVQTEEGWTLVKLESRRTLRLAPLSERREAIAKALREEAIAAAMDKSRDEFPTQVRSAEAIIEAAPDFPAGMIAAARIKN